MNLKQNTQLMKSQTFGVEIEMGKISKKACCELVAKYFMDTYGVPVNMYYDGSHHSNYVAYDHKGRKWQFMDDGSSSGRLGCISCEMVTPILMYDDIPDLQAIVRILRANGARSGYDYNAGVHIHIGADFDTEGGQNATTIRHLVNIIASHEKILNKAIAVTPQRHDDWARDVNPSFLRAINEQKPKTKHQLGVLWYGGEGAMRNASHYDRSRYHLLNLHAIWDKGTIEFRCFEFKRGLHAGELKAWIQLCMAMCNYAKMVTRSSYEPVDMSNEKYAMKNWLINMGFVGDEFKTARKVLTKRLLGDCAYKNGRATSDDDEILDTMAYGGMND